MSKQAFLTDLAELMEIDVSEFNEIYPLDGNENWDSLTRVSTVAIIDEHYQLSLDYSDVRDVKCIGDLLNLIDQKKSGNTRSA